MSPRITSLAPVTVGALAAGCYGLISPWLGLYQIDPDEGLNLGKAALVAAGYPPYGEMWNDQGPVLTYALAGLQALWPGSVLAARLLVMAMSGLLLGGLFHVIRRDAGWLAAVAAVVVLGTAPYYVKLSSSVMIGLPAIAIAVAALAVADWRSPNAAWRALASGLLFGLSLQTKLFTLAMLPALLLAVSGFAAGNRGWPAIRLALIWAAAVFAAFLAIMLASGQIAVDSLVATHAAPALRAGYSLASSLGLIVVYLNEARTVWVLGLLGLLVLLATGTWRGAIVPFAWFAIGFLAFALHHPVFYHQVLLLLVPLAWFAGAGLSTLLAPTAKRWRRQALAAASVLLLLVAGWGLFRLPSRATELAPNGLAAEAMAPYAALGGWAVADYPMAAFRNTLLLPPELVVFSQKRRDAGNLTDADIIASIRMRRPVQVVFERFAMPAEVLTALADDYVVAARGLAAYGFSTQPYIQYVLRQPELGVDRSEVRQRLDTLVETMAATNGKGGYAFASRNGTRLGETDEDLPPEAIWMRPPGATYDVGGRLLAAFERTGDIRQRDLAVAAALAVARAQTCNGGWVTVSVPESSCGAVKDSASTREDFDDGLQAGAIEFLLAAADRVPDTPEAAQLRAAARDGVDFLLASQLTNGAWPRVARVQTGYRRLPAIGDSVTTSHIRILLQAGKRFSDVRYREAAMRGLEFLLAAQLPSGAWAQQYEMDLTPAAGRSFEPAAAASVETAVVVLALLEAAATLDNPRFFAAAQRAVDWLIAAQLEPEEPEVWARFYDLERNQPIYGDRDGTVHARLEDISEERRNGYDWRGRFSSVLDAIRLARAMAVSIRFYFEEREAIAAARQIARAAEILRPADARPAGSLVTADWLREVDAILAALDLTSEPAPGVTAGMPR